jgi:hypothetical protein
MDAYFKINKWVLLKKMIDHSPILINVPLSLALSKE